MSSRVARAIQYIKRPVAEIVKCIEISNFAFLREGNLSQLSALVVALQNSSIWVRRISWHELVLESRANDQSCFLTESRWVARMIPVEVAPDNTLYVIWAHTVLFEDLTDVFLCFTAPFFFTHAIRDDGREILVIPAHTEVEEKLAG